jgi:prophage DNA circulation protein
MPFGFTYEDRQGIALIQTPDGSDYEFEYADLEIGKTKKTSSYDFGETPKQLIQDFGLGAVSIPITAYFSGPNYDIEANKFDLSLEKKGRSRLWHPVYGYFDIVITG